MSRFISPLDSERFGFNIAKFSGPVDGLCSILEELKNIDTKLIIARAETCDLDYINELEIAGFLLKDVQITYNFNLAQTLPFENEKNGVSIVPFDITHFAELMAITRESFDNYGHYFADKKLDRTACKEIYSDWFRRCCEDSEVSDNIAVALKDNVAIGYLASKVSIATKESYLAGVIGAVSSKHRNLNVFTQLNIFLLSRAKKNGIERFENNVLVTNLPVAKAYSKLSFQIIRSEMTLHYWFK